jgi:hypothetical protein
MAVVVDLLTMMATNLRRTGLAGLLSLSLGGYLSAGVLPVSGKSEIFSAGQAAPFDGGTLPPSFGFIAGAGQTLTFSSVTGTVSCDGSAGCTSGGDGVSMAGFTGTNIGCTTCGIGSIQFIGRQFFLVGVFLDAASVPSGANPSPLPGYTDASALGSIFSPGLNQVFFIGDGQGTGGTQTFNVPTTAARLFLGFADGAPLFGSAGTLAIPNSYADNTGSLTATFAISAVPEPGTMALFALGFAAIAVARKTQLI